MLTFLQLPHSLSHLSFPNSPPQISNKDKSTPCFSNSFTFFPKSEEFYFYSSLLGPKVKNKVFLRFFELFFTFLNYSSLLVQKVKNIQKFFTFKFNVTVLMRWDVWIVRFICETCICHHSPNFEPRHFPA